MQVLKIIAICVGQFCIGFLAGYLFMRLMQWMFGVVAAGYIGLVVMIALCGWIFALFMPASVRPIPSSKE